MLHTRTNTASRTDSCLDQHVMAAQGRETCREHHNSRHVCTSAILFSNVRILAFSILTPSAATWQIWAVYSGSSSLRCYGLPREGEGDTVDASFPTGKYRGGRMAFCETPAFGMELLMDDCTPMEINIHNKNSLAAAKF